MSINLVSGDNLPKNLTLIYSKEDKFIEIAKDSYIPIPKKVNSNKLFEAVENKLNEWEKDEELDVVFEFDCVEVLHGECLSYFRLDLYNIVYKIFKYSDFLD